MIPLMQLFKWCFMPLNQREWYTLFNIKTSIVRFNGKWVHIVVQSRCYTMICIFYATEHVAIQEKGRRARKNSVFQTTSMCDLAKMRQNDAHKNGLFLAAPPAKKDKMTGRARKFNVFEWDNLTYAPSTTDTSKSTSKCTKHLSSSAQTNSYLQHEQPWLWVYRSTN